MAAGLPVVTNTPGEVADMVKEAGAGVAVAPSAIAAGVRELLNSDPGALAAMGERGRAWMEANRSRRALAAQLEALLDQLVPE